MYLKCKQPNQTLQHAGKAQENSDYDHTKILQFQPEFHLAG